MGNFFQKVMDEHLLENTSTILDWLLDDKKFSGPDWTSGKKRKFTNSVMRLKGFGKATFKKKACGEAYPKKQTKRNRLRKPYALFSSNGSLGQDFVRHIRNGIAHGHAEVYKAAGVDYVEITDWGKNNGGLVQTAHISIPLSYLDSILRLYREVEEGSSHQKKGRKR